MYRYDLTDKTLVHQRVAQFRDQTQRFLKGALSEDEFKHLRLRNGLYIQRHAPMLRISIPYGLLSTRQLRTLAKIARDYDRRYGHFTTRQNLQFNWPKLEQVPDILAGTRRGGDALPSKPAAIAFATSPPIIWPGSRPTSSRTRGPGARSSANGRRFIPEFTYLPRKFKIAVTGAPQDRAASLVHDVGVHIVRGAERRISASRFSPEAAWAARRSSARWCGNSCRASICCRTWQQYCASITWRAAATICTRRASRFWCARLGIEEFRRRVEAEWQLLRDAGLRIDDAEVARMRGFFNPPDYLALPDIAPDCGEKPAFRAWYRYNTTTHKVAGYRAVYISLKKPGVPPGDATDAQMDLIADLADRYSFGEVRVTHTQNLLLADVEQGRTYELWQQLEKRGTRDAQHRDADRYHLLSGTRLLQSRECGLHRCREAHQRAFRRLRLYLRFGRDRHQNVGLHECLRASPCRQHRRTRRR